MGPTCDQSEAETPYKSNDDARMPDTHPATSQLKKDHSHEILINVQESTSDQIPRMLTINGAVAIVVFTYAFESESDSLAG